MDLSNHTEIQSVCEYACSIYVWGIYVHMSVYLYMYANMTCKYIGQFWVSSSIYTNSKIKNKIIKTSITVEYY